MAKAAVRTRMGLKLLETGFMESAQVLERSKTIRIVWDEHLVKK